MLVFNIVLLIVSAVFLQSSDAAITCAIGQSFCGTTCYNPKLQSCLSGIVCNSGESVCGSTCYNPKLKSCPSGILCNVGQSVCNGACYTPGEAFCTLYYGLCPVTSSLCFGSAHSGHGSSSK